MTAPIEFNFEYNLFVFMLYALALAFYFEKKSFVNYLDFEPIFIVIATMMIFVFPLLVFDYDTAFLFSFNKEYSLNFINKGTSVSAIAMVSFLIGNLTRVKLVNQNVYSPLYVDNKYIVLVCFCFYLIFLLGGGFEKYKLLYLYGKEMNSFTNYFEPILIALSQILIFNEIWNKSKNKFYRINKIYIAFLVLIILQFLLSGARTIASYIVLPIISFYTFRFIPFSFIKMIFFIVCSVLTMSFLQSYRSGYDLSLVLDWYYKLSDILIPNTNTYLALDIVDKNGVSYGLTSLSSILLLMPFMQSYVQVVFEVGRNTLNSADVFTLYLDAPMGMGTNFIAELYLGFGLLGIIFFPFIFGYILVRLKGLQYVSYFQSITLFVLCGFSVYLVRSGLFYMLRFVVYALFFASLNISILNRFRK